MKTTEAIALLKKIIDRANADRQEWNSSPGRKRFIFAGTQAVHIPLRDASEILELLEILQK